MTRIDFYVNVANREITACSVTAKAIERDMRVFVLAAGEDDAARIDLLLWSKPQLGFVPHVRAAHPLATQTPVIVDHSCETLPHDELLLNLTDTMPAQFSRFERLVEIVSVDEADRQRGRQRWRFYAERGYELKSHDLARAQTPAAGR